VRPAHDRVFRGVCAAIGRATGTDPVLWRVLVVVLAVFGGTGIVLYLAGWLLIPEEGRPESEAQRVLRGGSVSTPATVVAVLVGVIALVALTDGAHGTVPLLVVAGIGFLVVRNRQVTAGGLPPGQVGAPPPGWVAPPAWTQPTAPAGAPPAWGPPPSELGHLPPPPPAPPRPRSALGLLTTSAAVLVVGGLLLARALGADGIGPTAVLAAALLVTGAGLVVGARWGRSRGLIALAVLLGLALAGTTSVDHRWGTATGERTWTVTGSTSQRLAAGKATLDLRPLAGTAPTGLTVTAKVGAGQLVVLVPDDLRVHVEERAAAGNARVFAPDGAMSEQNGTDVHRTLDLGPAGAPQVQLDLRVGLGEVEVRRVAAQ
jgi:phage shock protein PspC (stress-responsive transcriptional regulator)